MLFFLIKKKEDCLTSGILVIKNRSNFEVSMRSNGRENDKIKLTKAISPLNFSERFSPVSFQKYLFKYDLIWSRIIPGSSSLLLSLCFDIVFLCALFEWTCRKGSLDSGTFRKSNLSVRSSVSFREASSFATHDFRRYLLLS